MWMLVFIKFGFMSNNEMHIVKWFNICTSSNLTLLVKTLCNFVIPLLKAIIEPPAFLKGVPFMPLWSSYRCRFSSECPHSTLSFYVKICLQINFEF